MLKSVDPVMAKIIDPPSSNLSREHSELQLLRSEGQSATRVQDAIQTILKEDRDVGSAARDRLTKYLNLLVSTGKTDTQLVIFGTGYLNEIREPDSRYSGC